ncbi:MULTISPECIES: DEAD/DEAH box helicase [Actinosynnema]|uniref:DEAD/DEAH box helicase n=1 Tax=Actinosynnema TaxID=40566 RepID=UPI0020A48106|nr:DEAD/DEAH box helicase [Actinosynnema pretiosum]MCP2098096.1 Helicase conserved C-terminal domain-containing protein [Actinosynnema pretiosum]
MLAEDSGWSVADVAQDMWQVRPEPAVDRFDLPGWTYERQVVTLCPNCGGRLHTLRKPYESAGKQYQYVALVCPQCPATFTLDSLGIKSYAALLKDRPSRTRRQRDSRPPAPDGEDTTVAGVAQKLWGARPGAASSGHLLPGWVHLRESSLRCPVCATALHGLSRVYQRNGRQREEEALVCPLCPASYTARALRTSRRKVLKELHAEQDSPIRAIPAAEFVSASGGSAIRGARGSDCDAIPAPGVRVRRVHGASAPALLKELLEPVAVPRRSGNGPARPAVPTRPTEHRLLHWCKTTNPNLVLPQMPYGVDVRVLLPDVPSFDRLRAHLAGSNASYRSVAHWVEDETISTVGPQGELLALSVSTGLRLGGDRLEWSTPALDLPAYDARDAFVKTWDAHEEIDPASEPQPVAATRFVPDSWLPYLPFDRFNPAQAEAAPVVLGSDEHLVVTAPTGAGKTVVGLLAALRTILVQCRKAAWLVPQRSLTEELNRELAGWRRLGLRVEQLSGEYNAGVEKLHEADLWVATTEKFEAICRTNSLQTALADVGCLVVDEIHLLGAPGRGPLLEALLARVQGVGSPVRIVGLSATVANAAEIADWLHGRLVATTWRPSRVTWQLPAVPAHSDRAADTAARTKASVELTRRFTDGEGSVLVFCGTKHNVRATALALAADRGAAVAGVSLDDPDRLHEVCASVGIGLHYKDWEFKTEAEQRFRARQWDVLVATTTVAAGVNLPARAVVVRDTRIGLDDLDVATVQQMFGRAGRVGAGEREGWAYLVTTEVERAAWQGALVDGYSVHSQIHDSLADHVLAEVLQGRIGSLEQAERWWLRTLCHHQGDEDTEPVVDAVVFLVDNAFLVEVPGPDGIPVLEVTELGKLTARLMVDTRTAAVLRAVLDEEAVPTDPERAEAALIRIVATAVPELAYAPVAEPQRPIVASILKASGHPDQITPDRAVSGLGSAKMISPGDLAQAALLLVANSPRLFTGFRRTVAGLPNNTVFPVLDRAPRYLAWLGAQGALGTVHPWAAIVAADLGRRVRWRQCAPRRGAGRLLWMMEQMATPLHATELVPALWRAATGRGVDAPDWTSTTPPAHCKLDPGDYVMLLRERTTGCTLTDLGVRATVDGLSTGVLTLWNCHATNSVAIDGTTTAPHPPPRADCPPDTHAGVAVFTKRGDHKALGWLEAYSSTSRCNTAD